MIMTMHMLMAHKDLLRVKKALLLAQKGLLRVKKGLLRVKKGLLRVKKGLLRDKKGLLRVKKALVLARSFKTSEYLSMIRQLAPDLDNAEPGRLSSAKLPSLRNVVVMDDNAGPGVFTFEQIKNLGGPAQQLRLSMIDSSLNPDDAINVQFTSGTTGAPKGATLSHYNIINNARFVTDRIGLTDADRLCIPVPLYHCFGMVMGVLGDEHGGHAIDRGAAFF